jgi:diacylglycerol kinase (ATP)
MRFWIIVNPSAGRGRCARLLPEVRASLGTTGHQIHWLISESQEHLTMLARSGARQRVDAIVACGGDGTVHYILQALVGMRNAECGMRNEERTDRSPVPAKQTESTSETVSEQEIQSAIRNPQSAIGPALGIIPMGRGNDLAQSLGIPLDYRRACEVLRRGQTRRLDVANAGGRIYASVAGAGFDAEVNALANQDSAWLRGKAVYVNAVFRALSKFKPKRLEIEYDDRRFVGEAMLVAIGNTTSYGGGLKIVPQAQPDDGWLDVCVVKKTTKLELLRQLPSAYKGKHVNHPAIEMYRARRVTISSPDPVELFGDGEFLQPIPVTIEIIPQALRVIVP